MRKTSVRKLVTDAIWEQLEPALHAAKHSKAGALAATPDREFLEAILHLLRTGKPWRDLPAEFGYWHAHYMRFRRWDARGVWRQLWQKTPGTTFGPGARFVSGFDDGARIRTRLRRKKNGSQQALGRSRGGFTTKIHAATIDENCAVALHLSEGQAHDGRQFEALYESPNRIERFFSAASPLVTTKLAKLSLPPFILPSLSPSLGIREHYLSHFHPANDGRCG